MLTKIWEGKMTLNGQLRQTHIALAKTTTRYGLDNRIDFAIFNPTDGDYTDVGIDNNGLISQQSPASKDLYNAGHNAALLTVLYASKSTEANTP